MTNPYSIQNYQRTKLAAPLPVDRMLLHSCCAPCSIEVIEAIIASGIMPTVFFYNPNIHPIDEYELRKNENKRYCEQNNIPFKDMDYDADNWFSRIKGLENEPERGERCTVCFDMRFERTALFAFENDFKLISSSLGISRWKNMQQINDCGQRAAGRYENIIYWDFNWRKEGGSGRMFELSKAYQFYQQEYCGCVYSLRDTNRWRQSRGRERIKRGVKFYHEKGIADYNSNIIAKA